MNDDPGRPTRRCPHCGAENPPQARYCFESACGLALDEGPTPLAGAALDARRVAGRLRRRVLTVVPVAVVGLVGGGIAVVRSGGATTKPPVAAAASTTAAVASAPTEPATTSPSGRGRPLPVDQIKSAMASSTLPDDATHHITYGIENTLDGDFHTGWNSAGSAGARVAPEGQTLTYEFSAPVNIVGIRLFNGFEPENGRSEFEDNYRIKDLGIAAGSQSVTWTLADEFVPQSIELALGSVDSVTLTVMSVYPTNKYQDVGLSEVQFFVDP